MNIAPIALLVDYTREDREAKGLRKLAARVMAAPPVPDTVLEAIAHEPLLLLAGECGCGKSTSLRELARRLTDGSAREGRPVVRNDTGEAVLERWGGPDIEPVLLTVEAPTTLSAMWADFAPDRPVLLMFDQAERLGMAGESFLDDVAALASAWPALRVVVAVDADATRAWRVSPTWTRRRIISLIEPQRLELREAARPDSQAADWARASNQVRDHIGWFSLALSCGSPMAATPEEVLDRWVSGASRRSGQSTEALASLGADGFEHPIEIRDEALSQLRLGFVQRQLAAQRLATEPPAATVSRLLEAAVKWSPVVEITGRLVAERAGDDIDTFLMTLLDSEAVESVAVVAAIVSALPHERVATCVHAAIRERAVQLIERGQAPATTRRDVGRALALERDPRDLEELMSVVGGLFTMGSESHPNSAPAHGVALQSFRIARYPVVNRHYLQFIEATGRAWRSQDGRAAGRANAPAVDLTWHDARAYCDWLTLRWRDSGRVAADERVRLPTEAEWERAARGVRIGNGLMFPWAGDWQPDCANSEEVGFNDTCAVGLFPRGRSDAGCDDMAGQVWEWVSTLWGTDMATPTFRYPYVAEDGREDPAAPPDVRRVLRGACFLSPREKANCIYRGSLEPDGFWRGNGFRVAVGPK